MWRAARAVTAPVKLLVLWVAEHMHSIGEGPSCRLSGERVFSCECSVLSGETKTITVVTHLTPHAGYSTNNEA